MSAPFTFEGVVAWDYEDAGRARIATISDDADKGLFVRIQSWDDDRVHEDAQTLTGKRVRVTIEVL